MEKEDLRLEIRKTLSEDIPHFWNTRRCLKCGELWPGHPLAFCEKCGGEVTKAYEVSWFNNIMVCRGNEISYRRNNIETDFLHYILTIYFKKGSVRYGDDRYNSTKVMVHEEIEKMKASLS